MNGLMSELLFKRSGYPVYFKCDVAEKLLKSFRRGQRRDICRRGCFNENELMEVLPDIAVGSFPDKDFFFVIDQQVVEVPFFDL